jgi:hypothetical protein
MEVHIEEKNEHPSAYLKLINFLAFVTLPDEEDDIVDVVVVIQYNEG